MHSFTLPRYKDRAHETLIAISRKRRGICRSCEWPRPPLIWWIASSRACPCVNGCCRFPLRCAVCLPRIPHCWHRSANHPPSHRHLPDSAGRRQTQRCGHGHHHPRPALWLGIQIPYLIMLRANGNGARERTLRSRRPDRYGAASQQ